MFPFEMKVKFLFSRTDGEEKLFWITDRMFIIMHWLFVIFCTSAAFFTGVSDTDTTVWDMSLYCADETFNKALTFVDLKWPIITVFAVSVIIILLICLEMYICGATSVHFLNITNYFLGLLLSWNITFVLQSLISYPIPSFFQNRELEMLYCSQNCTISKLITQIEQLDRDSRGSFPSFVTCSTAYAAVFLFLLASELDKGQRFAAKLLALLLPGGISLVYGWYLWQYNQNHIQDVIGGAVIGSLMAVYVAKELFVPMKTLEKLREDLISVLMTKEVGLEDMSIENAYTPPPSPVDYSSDLDSQDPFYNQLEDATSEDMPPPYASLEF